ncbi:DUF5994 family protein [Qaidamihabitans albus]|uniref:DUF5994 family protein n=1 Tax=Qaidamihabitans albus TaxID=2795733 RepID=UPI0018F15688|nr:DUF5994 family protein [Qaidamihabitans albus]
MTSGPRLSPNTPSAGQAREPRRQPLRLRLKPEIPTTGYVDGAWWPRSRALPAELPGLLAVLAARLGPIERVTYSPATWEAAPRRISVDGRSIRLDGFHAQHADTVTVTGTNRQRVTLLAVPPAASSASAHHCLAVAARLGNVETPEQLLDVERPARTVAVRREPAAAAVQRWELEGGRLYEPATDPGGTTAIERSLPRMAWETG